MSKTEIPSIRFHGFDDAWEQRKVSELFRVTRGYVLAATQTETTKTDEKPYPVYSSQTKDKGLMGYYKGYQHKQKNGNSYPRFLPNLTTLSPFISVSLKS